MKKSEKLLLPFLNQCLVFFMLTHMIGLFAIQFSIKFHEFQLNMNKFCVKAQKT